MNDKKISEKYLDNRTVRTLVNLVPHIGGALDVLLSETGNKYRSERLEKLLGELDERISHATNSDELIKKIKNSEEFYDILVQCITSSLKTRHSEKLKCYSNILYKQLTTEQVSSDLTPELLVTIVDGLTLQELHYLRAVEQLESKVEFHVIRGKMVFWNRYQKILKQSGRPASVSEELPSTVVFNYPLEIIWKFLIDKNLIKIEYSRKPGVLSYSYGTSNARCNSNIDYSDILTIRLTEFGDYFVDWLKGS